MSDVTPFARRRQRVLAEIGRGALVLFAAKPALRNNDVSHEFRQDSDFYYLTGFEESDAALVLVGGESPRSVLFVHPRDPEREVWDGPRLGVDGAKTLGCDEVFPISELAERLPRLIATDRLICQFGDAALVDPRIVEALVVARRQARRGAAAPATLIDSATVVHELRRIKGAEEVTLMQRAADVTAEAHLRAMAEARPGAYEYEIEAVLRSVFRARGSQRLAYEPIVGSGHNATILHYIKNERQMQDGDLLLIDAGCEVGYYAADVTRTFPVSGYFSKPQREIYEIVLAAQHAALAAVRPGATLDAIHAAAVRALCEGLLARGVLSGSLEQAQVEGSYKPFFMHKTSHYLGMDVHDVGRYFDDGKPRPLDPGVVITVEPGLYFGRDANVAPEYRGIGIRIEDDVVVETDGMRLLTGAIPKEPGEVERACRR